MADGQHKLSRRALLGAVCAAPAVSVIPAEAGTSGRPAPSTSHWGPGFRRDDEAAESFVVTKWDRALARFEKAEAAIAAAAGAPDHVYDPIGARRHAALRRLLRTPAQTSPPSPASSISPSTSEPSNSTAT